MRLFLKILFLNLIFFTSIFSNIFRTSVYPGRIFVSEEGEIETIEITNFSTQRITILLSMDTEFSKHIKFYPKTFILSPNMTQVVHTEIKSSFFTVKNPNKIIYITEIKPLAEFNNQKIMPRHGITVINDKFKEDIK